MKPIFNITNRMSMFCIGLVSLALYSSIILADSSGPVSPAKSDSKSFSSLTIHVDQIRSPDGHIIALLFNDEKGFPSDQALAFRVYQIEVKGTAADLVMDNIPQGSYVVSLFHDSNDDGELNRYWYGAPKEGVGVSNNVKGHFGPPDYDKCVVPVTEKQQVLRVSLHYL